MALTTSVGDSVVLKPIFNVGKVTCAKETDENKKLKNKSITKN